jgi:hypothetical protein
MSKLLRQCFDRNVTTKLAIVRPIYFTHAAGAYRRHDAIGSEFPAKQRFHGRQCDRHVLKCGYFQKTPGLFFLRQ